MTGALLTTALLLYVLSEACFHRGRTALKQSAMEQGNRYFVLAIACTILAFSCLVWGVR